MNYNETKKKKKRGIWFFNKRFSDAYINPNENKINKRGWINEKKKNQNQKKRNDKL